MDDRQIKSLRGYRWREILVQSPRSSSWGLISQTTPMIRSARSRAACSADLLVGKPETNPGYEIPLAAFSLNSSCLLECIVAMDPLSVAASVGDLTCACLTIANKLNDIVGRYKGASQLVRNIHSETKIIGLSLSQLQSLLLDSLDETLLNKEVSRR